MLTVLLKKTMTCYLSGLTNEKRGHNSDMHYKIYGL
jgi:hypothetical protein